MRQTDEREERENIFGDSSVRAASLRFSLALLTMSEQFPHGFFNECRRPSENPELSSTGCLLANRNPEAGNFSSSCGETILQVKCVHSVPKELV